MKKGEHIMYNGCLIVKRASNNYSVYWCDHNGEVRKTAISLNNAKAIINTFHK